MMEDRNAIIAIANELDGQIENRRFVYELGRFGADASSQDIWKFKEAIKRHLGLKDKAA